MYPPKREKILTYEVAAQKLLQLIKENELQQGDRLPSERLLSEKLGISRTSLREALQSLETNGIINIRQGSGIYVDIYDDSMASLYGEVSQNYREILSVVQQMLEMRMMTEVYCVRQAAKVITSEQLIRLQEHEEEEFRKLYYRDRGIVAPPGLDFEQLIISFLGNPIISNTHKRLNSSWKSYLASINAVVLPPDKRHKDHLAIIAALQERNAAKAEKAIYRHLSKSGKLITSLIEQRL